jgi:hypothetical protein
MPACGCLFWDGSIRRFRLDLQMTNMSRYTGCRKLGTAQKVKLDLSAQIKISKYPYLIFKHITKHYDIIANRLKKLFAPPYSMQTSSVRPLAQASVGRGPFFSNCPSF